MNVTVNSAKEREVGVQRRNIGIERVVHLDGDDIVRAHSDIGGYIEHECGKTALMLSDERAVHIHVGDDIRAIELQKQLPVRVRAIYRVVSSVPANAPVVVVAAILTIEIVPSVWDANRSPREIIKHHVRGGGNV